MSSESPEKNFSNPQEKLKSKIICSWCNKIMGETEGVEGGKDSHGICPDCKEKYFSKPNEKEPDQD